MARLHIFVFFIFSLLSSSSTSDILSDVERNIPNHKFIYGNFFQTQEISGFNFPLRSQGVFQYGQGIGLTWITKTPLFQATTFTSSNLYKWNEEGEITHSDTISPIEKKIIEIVNAMLSGNIQPLRSQFTIQQSQHSDHWKAELSPKDPTTGKIISTITLLGNTHIEEATIITSNGDRTSYTFNQVQYSNVIDTSTCRYLNIPNVSLSCSQ